MLHVQKKKKQRSTTVNDDFEMAISSRAFKSSSMDGPESEYMVLILPHLLVPYKDGSQEKRLDVWVQLLSNTKPDDLLVEVSPCGMYMQIKHSWSESMALLNLRCLFKGLKNSSRERPYSKDHI